MCMDGNGLGVLSVDLVVCSWALLIIHNVQLIQVHTKVRSKIDYETVR